MAQITKAEKLYDVFCYQGPKHNTRLLTRRPYFTVMEIPDLEVGPPSKEVVYKIASFWCKPVAPEGPNHLYEELPALEMSIATVDDVDSEEAVAFLMQRYFGECRTKLEVVCTPYLRGREKREQEILNQYREVVKNPTKRYSRGTPVKQVLELLRDELEDKELRNLMVRLLPHLSDPSLFVLANFKSRVEAQPDYYGTCKNYMAKLRAVLRVCISLELASDGQQVRRVQNLSELTLTTEI